MVHVLAVRWRSLGAPSSVRRRHFVHCWNWPHAGHADAAPSRGNVPDSVMDRLLRFERCHGRICPPAWLGQQTRKKTLRKNHLGFHFMELRNIFWGWQDLAISHPCQSCQFIFDIYILSHPFSCMAYWLCVFAVTLLIGNAVGFVKTRPLRQLRADCWIIYLEVAVCIVYLFCSWLCWIRSTCATLSFFIFLVFYFKYLKYTQTLIGSSNIFFMRHTNILC